MAKILIVDDEKMICEEFQDILRDDNHDVEIALNGIEALEKVQETSFDLIFLDVLMPRMEGREVFEQVRKISQVPIVIMSGYLPPNKEQDVIKMGALACMRKPLDLQRVRRIIQSVSAKKPTS